MEDASRSGLAQQSGQPFGLLRQVFIQWQAHGAFVCLDVAKGFHGGPSMGIIEFVPIAEQRDGHVRS